MLKLLTSGWIFVISPLCLVLFFFIAFKIDKRAGLIDRDYYRDIGRGVRSEILRPFNLSIAALLFAIFVIAPIYRYFFY